MHRSLSLACVYAHLVGKLCPMLCNPLDRHPPGSCSWDFPGKNTGVGCHFLLQEIFSTRGSDSHLLHLLHWEMDSLPLSYLGSPDFLQLPASLPCLIGIPLWILKSENNETLFKKEFRCQLRILSSIIWMFLCGIPPKKKKKKKTSFL